MMGVNLMIVLYWVSSFPSAQQLERVDTPSNKHSILSKNEAVQAVFGSVALARTEKPKLITLGPSTVREGFFQEDWAEIASNYEYHNFGVGSLNPEQTVRLFKHIKAEIKPQIAKKSIIIVGASYPVFSDSRLLENYIEMEESKLLSFYALGGFNWASWPVSYAKRISPALFFVREQLFDSIDRLIKEVMLVSNPKPAVKIVTPPVNAPIVDLQKRKAAMYTWDIEIMGGKNDISERQFNYFINLIECIHDAGFSVIVVDMPLPRWHRDASHYDKIFQNRLNNLMTSNFANIPNIEFINIHDDLDEVDFKDSAHSNRSGAKAIARLIKSRSLLLKRANGD